MGRIAHQRLRVGELDDAAKVHDPDPPAAREIPRDREVVRDQHDRDAEFGAEREQQIQQADPDRDVHHRHRFIRDDHARIDGQRPRDRHPLALAARKLVRVFRDEVLGWAQIDTREKLVDCRERLPSVPRLPVPEQGRRQRLVHGPRRIE